MAVGKKTARRQATPLRRKSSDDKRAAILAAGLAVFAASGFQAARLDDVATRAGVAKGTIYLFFETKEQLFEEIVLAKAAPVLSTLDALSQRADVPAREAMAALLAVFRKDVLETDRKAIVRLILNEGAHFPRIAAFYHREVVSKGLGIVRRLLERAAKRGEIASDATARFPQLIVAPMLLAVLWDGIFQKIEPLDIDGLFAAHLDVLFQTSKPRKGRN